MEQRNTPCYGRPMDRPICARMTAIAARAPLLIGALVLAACTPSADEVRARHESGAATSAASQPDAPRSATHMAASSRPSEADYVAAVATTKASLPLTVRFRLDSKPRVGQPLVVDLMVTPMAMTQIRSLKFHFEAGEGVQLQGDPEFVVNGATPGIAVHREIQVVPGAVGVLELRAHAAVETPSEALSQTYTIPLIVVAATP